MEGKYVPTYRREDDRKRRYINTTLNISMKLIITTAVLH
jgi:RNase P subunit RPR2